jgi:hypothetical protein
VAHARAAEVGAVGSHPAADSCGRSSTAPGDLAFFRPILFFDIEVKMADRDYNTSHE